ncbi:hypothetical protein M3148_02705 [Georgenia satyanarayanai]|uniref:hypothetical protein n=1 Tax=Georgenia satyanarayanai TaxID=860221 RepID=UPI00203BD887|nr:hypothetical protein [Georgenia satyanarayanai]MCM3659909.1 hypothetical protein [Georgenia satyanarayanai]
MTLWLRVHRSITPAVIVVMCAILSGLIGTTRLPALNLTGHFYEGFPVRVVLPAIASSSVLASLATPTSRAQRAASRPPAALEIRHVLGFVVLAGLLAEALTLVSGSGDLGVFTRNVAGMAGAGLLFRRHFGVVVAAIVPVAWGIAMLTFGNPNGDQLMSWPGLPSLSVDSLVQPALLLVAGLLVGTGRGVTTRAS